MQKEMCYKKLFKLMIDQVYEGPRPAGKGGHQPIHLI